MTRGVLARKYYIFSFIILLSNQSIVLLSTFCYCIARVLSHATLTICSTEGKTVESLADQHGSVSSQLR